MQRLVVPMALTLVLSACVDSSADAVDSDTSNSTGTTAQQTGDAQMPAASDEGADPDTGVDSGTDSSNDPGGSESDDGAMPTGWDPNAIPVSTGPCPDLAEGWNSSCRCGIEICREAYVRRRSANPNVERLGSSSLS